MKNKKIFIALILLISVFVFSGCSLSLKTNGSSTKKGPDGGVFVSTDKGINWKQTVLIPTVKGEPGTIGGLDGYSLAIDPSDNNSIYYGSIEKGLFYTYNIDEGWMRVKGLDEGTIRSIAVDSENKCIIYATLANRLYKTEDCGRTFSQVYFDNDPEVKINYVAIDHYDSNKIYIGTSRGELIKSFDKGKSWQTILRAGSEISKIVMSPSDSRIIFVGTEKKGVFRSINSGEDWLSLGDSMKDFKNSDKIRDLVVAKDETDVVFLATTYGVFKSIDNGDTWQRIELITPEKESTINALAVNPKNSKEIYYVTKTTFYSSSDGGDSWSTRSLPSSRSGWNLLISPADANVLYLTVREIK